MKIKMASQTIGIDKVVVVGNDAPPPPPLPSSEMKLIVNPPYHFDLDFNIGQLEKDFIKSGSDNPPLILFDGVVISKSKMESINPDEIGYINALKDQSATNKYGDKGKHGVIEIVSKSKMATERKDKIVVVDQKANSIVFDDPKNEPLIYVDGKITDYNTMRAIKPDLIESINVLKGEPAIAKYGEKGKNGALELALKKGAVPEEAEVKYVIGYPMTSHLKTSASHTGVNLAGGDVAVVGYGKTADPKSSASPLGFSLRTDDSQNPPLYILDGVIIDKAKMDALNPETIESIKVVKDKSATDKYGEKAKDGVVEIELKKIGPTDFTTKKGELSAVSGSKQGDGPFVMVEQMPQYPGGEQALMKFIGANVKYPAQAKTNNVQGTVIANFIIRSTGKVDAIKIVRGVQADLDAEALRVIGLMPDWEPGMQGGKAVDVTYTLPIQFKLH